MIEVGEMAQPVFSRQVRKKILEEKIINSFSDVSSTMNSIVLVWPLPNHLSPKVVESLDGCQKSPNTIANKQGGLRGKYSRHGVLNLIGLGGEIVVTGSTLGEDLTFKVRPLAFGHFLLYFRKAFETMPSRL